jgi:hypothetical protein
VPGGVGEDAPLVAARLEVWLGRAKFQDQGFGLVEVVDREVEVELLWRALAGPAGCLVAVDSLETDEEPVLAGEPGEVAAGLSFIFKVIGGSVAEMVPGTRGFAASYSSGRLRCLAGTRCLSM